MSFLLAFLFHCILPFLFLSCFLALGLAWIQSGLRISTPHTLTPCNPNSPSPPEPLLTLWQISQLPCPTTAQLFAHLMSLPPSTPTSHPFFLRTDAYLCQWDWGSGHPGSPGSHL